MTINKIGMALLAGALSGTYIFFAKKKTRNTNGKIVITNAAERKHVILQAPKIEVGTIKSKIECIRPVRNETFNISYEQKSGKHIFHNYGHGGSGWTLLFGAVGRSMEMFANVQEKHSEIKNTQITVVGAGVIGLYTALRLIDLGYSVFVVAENFDNLASHNAGGLLAPISMKNSHDEKTQKIVDNVALESFKQWEAIIRGDDKRFIGCAKYMPVYSSDTTDAGFDVYIKNGLMKQSVPVWLQFGSNDAKPMLEYNTIYMDPIITMHKMHDELISKNVKFTRSHVQNFSEIESNVIFNCSGIGSALLNEDTLLEKVYGHLLELKDQHENTKEYMVFTEVQKNKYVYYIPKGEGLIGGTYVNEIDYKGPAEKYQLEIQQAAEEFFGQH